MFSLRNKKNYLWIILNTPSYLEVCKPTELLGLLLKKKKKKKNSSRKNQSVMDKKYNILVQYKYNDQ